MTDRKVDATPTTTTRRRARQVPSEARVNGRAKPAALLAPAPRRRSDRPTNGGSVPPVGRAPVVEGVALPPTNAAARGNGGGRSVGSTRSRGSRAPTVPPDRTQDAPQSTREPDVWDERVAGALGFLRRRLTGEYDVDEFGFDPGLAAATVYPVLRLLYQRYFRVEVSGIENLPPAGSALIVANHSGTVPMDALMLMLAVHDETPLRRHLRLLGADLVFRMPILSELARKFGSTLACSADAERLLRNGEYVGVFPEGFKGIGKPYSERYKLQRFGRGGFVAAALRTGAPIVPVSIVGAEEIYPILGNLKPLARVTGLPYVPVTPTFPWLGPLGMIPLPSKWLIEFGAPVDRTHFGDDADDPIVVFNLADQVRETIQQTLHTMLERRPDPFG